MRLGGEVDDDVRLAHERVDEGAVLHVPVPEPELLVLDRVERRERGEAPRVGEGVEDHDAVSGVMAAEVVNEVRAYEPGAARDEDGSHGLSATMKAWAPKKRHRNGSRT